MLHAILKKSRDVKIPGLLLYRCIFFSAFALRKADKLGELLLEEQINGIYRTITMLSNNQLSMLVFRIRIVLILAVQKGYDIRILLQRTGFTQVTEHGTLNLTRFNTTAQL